MRMWMIDPKILCRKHLFGEHFEIHKFRHIFVKGVPIIGRKGQIEPKAMEKRHNQLVTEMINRGYKHNSPYIQPDLDHYTDIDDFIVDVERSFIDLRNRCPECKIKICGNDTN